MSTSNNNITIEEINIDPVLWGKHLWIFLHAMAAAYPEQPDTNTSQAAYNMIQNLQFLLPCGNCRDHFAQLLADFPPETQNNTTLKQWVLDAHNRVNTRLGKEEKTWTLADVNRVYEQNRIEQTLHADHMASEITPTIQEVGYHMIATTTTQRKPIQPHAHAHAHAQTQSKSKSSTYTNETLPTNYNGVGIGSHSSSGFNTVANTRTLPPFSNINAQQMQKKLIQSVKSTPAITSMKNATTRIVNVNPKLMPSIQRREQVQKSLLDAHQSRSNSSMASPFTVIDVPSLKEKSNWNHMPLQKNKQLTPAKNVNRSTTGNGNSGGGGGGCACSHRRRRDVQVQQSAVQRQIKQQLLLNPRR
jgi:hypothetical protein